jgi:hypothetical protein
LVGTDKINSHFAGAAASEAESDPFPKRRPDRYDLPKQW